jgi:hypothetical protein
MLFPKNAPTEKRSACHSDLRFASLCSGQTGCVLEVFGFSMFFDLIFCRVFQKKKSHFRKYIVFLLKFSIAFFWTISIFLSSAVCFESFFLNDIFSINYSFSHFRSVLPSSFFVIIVSDFFGRLCFSLFSFAFYFIPSLFFGCYLFHLFLLLPLLL